MKDRLPNSEQFERLIQAILAKPSGETYSLDDFMAALKTDIEAAKAIAPVGSEITVNGVTQEISTFQGNVSGASSAGVTGVSVNATTYRTKTGNKTGTTAFYYDGSSWHLDSQTGQLVNLPDYGITVQGTPVNGDYVTVSVPTSDIVFQVAAYDHYELENGEIKHGVVLMSKDIVKLPQQMMTPNRAALAVTKKEIPAGKYSITMKDVAWQGGNNQQANGDYVFTLTKPVPVGGALTFDGMPLWINPTPSKFMQDVKAMTYDTDRKTVIESGLALTQYSASADAGATDLGTFRGGWEEGASFENEFGYLNVSGGVFASDPDYPVNILRQWANADKPEGQWWKPMSIFDLFPKSLWPGERDGFVYTLPAGLKKHMRAFKVQTILSMPRSKISADLGISGKSYDWNDNTGATLTDTGKTSQNSTKVQIVSVFDKVAIPSLTEIGNTSSYYDDEASSCFELCEGWKNNDRIKEWEGSPNRYALRTTVFVNMSMNVYMTNPNGSPSPDNAGIVDLGFAPIIVLG